MISAIFCYFERCPFIQHHFYFAIFKVGNEQNTVVDEKEETNPEMEANSGAENGEEKNLSDQRNSDASHHDDLMVAEGEKDVFSGLSDQEEGEANTIEGEISREQRSFARYESPRDAIIKEGGGQEEGGATKQTAFEDKPVMEPFESASSPQSAKSSPEATPTVS